MISLGWLIIILQFDLEIKQKDNFTATEYFEVAQSAFVRTRWNNTQVRLLGQDVTGGYSLTNTNCKKYLFQYIA
jgi:hypothetical protein